MAPRLERVPSGERQAQTWMFCCTGLREIRVFEAPTDGAFLAEKSSGDPKYCLPPNFSHRETYFSHSPCILKPALAFPFFSQVSCRAVLNLTVNIKYLDSMLSLPSRCPVASFRPPSCATMWLPFRVLRALTCAFGEEGLQRLALKRTLLPCEFLASRDVHHGPAALYF